MNELAHAHRAQIERLQGAMLALPKERQRVLEKRHHYAQGVYGRELHIPKGVCLVGRIHLQSQLNVVLKGAISVMTEEGMKRIEAPHTFTSPAGVKRAGYAHEDTIWLTILGTDKTDPEEIYETLTALNFAEYEALCRPALPGEQHVV